MQSRIICSTVSRALPGQGVIPVVQQAEDGPGQIMLTASDQQTVDPVFDDIRNTLPLDTYDGLPWAIASR